MKETHRRTITVPAPFISIDPSQPEETLAQRFAELIRMLLDKDEFCLNKSSRGATVIGFTKWITPTRRFEERDIVLGDFLRDTCVRTDACVYTPDLYSAYTEWASLHKQSPVSRVSLGRALSSIGFERDRAYIDGEVRRRWHGFAVLPRSEWLNGGEPRTQYVVRDTEPVLWIDLISSIVVQQHRDSVRRALRRSSMLAFGDHPRYINNGKALPTWRIQADCVLAPHQMKRYKPSASPLMMAI